MDTKEKIIYASIDLFSQKGYTETTIKEIATFSGIKPGSLYNHFASKSEMLDYILNMYHNYTQKNVLAKEEINTLIETKEPRDVLKALFYRYRSDEKGTYTKILKIILHEQYRNERVGEFMRTVMIQENENFVTGVIKLLMEKGKIGPVNYRYYGKILNDLCLASSLTYGHFSGTEEYKRDDRILMDDVLSFVIDWIITDSGKQERLLNPQHIKWVR